MKKSIQFKIWLCFILLCNSVSALAQVGHDNPEGTLEGNDPGAVPADSSFFTIGIVLVIVYYCFATINKRKKFLQRRY